MKLSIKIVFILAFATLALAQKGLTTLTYFVEEQITPDQDYMQIVVKIKAKESSLTEALHLAEETVQSVQKLALDYCKSYAKKKLECDGISSVGKFNVEPQYQTIRKEPVFLDFAVSYEVTISIQQTSDIGSLIDKINKKNGIEITEMKWKDKEEEDFELKVIQMGVEEGQKRCSNIGQALAQIVQIEEIAQFQLQEQEQEEEEEEEQKDEEQEVEMLVYRFTVECMEKKKKNSK